MTLSVCMAALARRRREPIRSRAAAAESRVESDLDPLLAGHLMAQAVMP